MLRRLFAPGRIMALVALVAAAIVAGMIVPSVAQAAEYCWNQAVQGPNGTITYVRVCKEIDPGHPGGPGGGGGTVPDCGLDKMAPLAGYGSFYCVGKAACAIKDNFVPYAPPSEPAPPGHEYKLQSCWPCGGCLGPPVSTFILDGPPARPLIVQAQEAFGNLNAVPGVVKHSPDTTAIVTLATWLWMDPGSFGVLNGSSAEGLVAVAEPDTTTWQTGDGATVTCDGPGTPYVDGGSSACTHTYTKASPHYNGVVTRHWQVHYEQGGNPVDIAGAPADLAADTPWGLAVAEAQVLTGPTAGPGGN